MANDGQRKGKHQIGYDHASGAEQGRSKSQPTVDGALALDLPPVAYLNGDWIATDKLALSVFDLGVRQSVTAVERLRTYGGRVFRPELYLQRWERTTQSLSIDGLPGADRTLQLINQCLKRNAAWTETRGDVGVTLIATPGVPSVGQSTLMLHLSEIDHQSVSQRRTTGQGIVVTDVTQPPEASWSRNIKVRARIHYYRADMIARNIQNDAVGVLVDADGSVTETSVANIAIVESGKIYSPLRSQVLSGVTETVFHEITAKSNLEWNFERISVERLRNADEVLLMGTTAGLWFAQWIDDPGASVDRGNVCKTLQELFVHLTEQVRF